MKEEREVALKFHGILRRYDNLVDQCKMCVKQGDDSLYDMYYKQKRFLERCDVIVSAGCKDNNIGSIATWLGADDRLLVTEYLAGPYPHRENDEDTFKVRNAIIEALEMWGPHKLADYKVALVTTDDAIGPWLKQLNKKEQKRAKSRSKEDRDESRYNMDDRSQQQQELDAWLEQHDDTDAALAKDADLKRVSDLWGENNIQLMTFATSRHPVIDMVCRTADEKKMVDKLEGVVHANLMACKLKKASKKKDRK